MDYDFEYFGKLFLTNVVLIEAKLLYCSKDLKLLIDLEFIPDILKYLHNLMVINGVISLFFLLKTRL
jgi:hypothetical protein